MNILAFLGLVLVSSWTILVWIDSKLASTNDKFETYLKELDLESDSANKEK